MTSLKTHLALNTAKLEKSVTFYRAFFGKDPVKLKPGYAKFEIDNPALNFTLNEGPVDGNGALNHLGIQVESTEEVDEAARRLTEAGLATWDERDTDCCYALQDKVWVRDPNGYAWEVFVVKVGDTRPDLEQCSEDSAASEKAECCEPGAVPCCTP
ncbi:MAG: ArsI/CadI family heavy metal resistance metalloenzyme [Gemmatimonadota bacterium]